MNEFERLAAIRAAAARVARGKRIRETPPSEAGIYAGRYRGPHREFTLVWVEEECGYRRHFDHDSPWLWEDPTVYSTTEVKTLTTAGAWCGSGSAHHVTASESPERHARQTPHQRGRFREQPTPEQTRS